MLAACALPPTPTPRPTPTFVPTATPTPIVAGPTYVQDVRPILAARCVKCHSGANPPRGLRLDTYEHVLAGSTYRAVVVPGDPDASELVRRIRGESVPRMPFDGPPFLDEAQIRLIEAWIAAGAPER